MLAWVAFNWLGSNNAACCWPKSPANRQPGAVAGFVDGMLSSNRSPNALPLSNTPDGLTLRDTPILPSPAFPGNGGRRRVEFSPGIKPITLTEKSNLAYVAISPRPRLYAQLRWSCRLEHGLPLSALIAMRGGAASDR